MTAAALEYIGNRLTGAGIPYAFMRWEDDDFPETYFVGEYLESPTLTREENGRQISTFILRGYTRGSWLSIEQAKETIESVLPVTTILPNGNGLCISYESAMPVPTADHEIKSIKIDFSINEWMVK